MSVTNAQREKKSWNYGRAHFKQCISCNGGVQLQEFDIYIGLVFCQWKCLCLVVTVDFLEHPVEALKWRQYVPPKRWNLSPFHTVLQPRETTQTSEASSDVSLKRQHQKKTFHVLRCHHKNSRARIKIWQVHEIFLHLFLFKRKNCKLLIIQVSYSYLFAHI